MPDASFWRGRRVFLTGHTGFKGSWLCLWLKMLGADVTGYALEPPSSPSMFDVCGAGDGVRDIRADVRDGARLCSAMKDAAPEVVIHMAAQPIVLDSYKAPAETYEINVMGTVNMFDAVRACGTARAVINITTDKCYDNREWLWGYREDDRLGGFDPYSNSKACSELVTHSYTSSFFNPAEHARHGTAVSTARAGNVIGGGDWAPDRLVPDMARAFSEGRRVVIRRPDSVRPWQHVLEPLRGYLLLAERLFARGPEFYGAWNFGPADHDAKPVSWIASEMSSVWGGAAGWDTTGEQTPHEAHFLKLDCSKARVRLGWQPRLGLADALRLTVEWYKRYYTGPAGMRGFSEKQIEEYSGMVEG